MLRHRNTSSLVEKVVRMFNRLYQNEALASKKCQLYDDGQTARIPQHESRQTLRTLQYARTSVAFGIQQRTIVKSQYHLSSILVHVLSL